MRSLSVLPTGTESGWVCHTWGAVSGYQQSFWFVDWRKESPMCDLDGQVKLDTAFIVLGWKQVQCKSSWLIHQCFQLLLVTNNHAINII